MMRMVSNVKVSPHANDIKEDQRDENGINANQDFGDDIRVKWDDDYGLAHNSKYVLWQAHILKICSKSGQHL